MFLGDDIELVTREDSLKLFNLLNPTGSQWNTGLLVEFMS